MKIVSRLFFTSCFVFAFLGLCVFLPFLPLTNQCKLTRARSKKASKLEIEWKRTKIQPYSSSAVNTDNPSSCTNTRLQKVCYSLGSALEVDYSAMDGTEKEKQNFITSALTAQKKRYLILGLPHSKVSTPTKRQSTKNGFSYSHKVQETDTWKIDWQKRCLNLVHHLPKETAPSSYSGKDKRFTPWTPRFSSNHKNALKKPIFC